MDDLPEKPTMKIEYVKPLRDGHRIKIILSEIVYPNQNNTFRYSIPGLNYGPDFESSLKNPQENVHVYLADLTFTEDQDDEIPLTVDLMDSQFVIISGQTTLPPVKVLSEGLVEVIDKGTTVIVGTVVTAAIASTAPMVLTGNLAMFWGLLDIMQIVSLMIYINAPYPFHVEIFFDKMTIAQLDFLPNWIDDLTVALLESLGQIVEFEIVDQTAPYRFDLKGKTSSFLENGGSMLSFQLMLVMISAVVSILRKLLANSSQKLANFMGRIEKLLDINFFIRGFYGVALPLAMAVQLQFVNINGSNAVNIVSAVLAFIAFIYMAIVTYYVFRISRSIRKEVKDKDIKQVVSRFSSVFEGLIPKEKWGAYYTFATFMKKYIIVYFLVFFQSVNVIQILCLTALYLMNSYILWKHRVWKLKRQHIVANLSEIFLLLAHILVAFYILEIVTSGQGRYVTGWMVITLIILTIMINMILIIYEQILNWQEVVVQFKKLWVRLKNVCKDRQTSKIRRASKFSKSSLKVRRIDRLNPEEVKGFGLNLELPIMAKQMSKGSKESAKLRTSGESLTSEKSKGLPKVIKRIKKSKTQEKPVQLRKSIDEDPDDGKEEIKEYARKMPTESNLEKKDSIGIPIQRRRKILRPPNTLEIKKSEKPESRIILPPE